MEEKKGRIRPLLDPLQSSDVINIPVGKTVWAAGSCPEGARLASASAWQLPHRRSSADRTSSMAQCHLMSS